MVVKEWLGTASAMVRHYYHLNDEEAKRQMESLDLLDAGKRFAGEINGTAIQQIGGFVRPGECPRRSQREPPIDSVIDPVDWVNQIGRRK